MKLENQVINLEIAKKLKELGVKQESLFYWVMSRTDEKTYVLDYQGSCGLCSRAYNGNYENKEISAFTVAELGEMLPDSYMSGKLFTPDEPKKWAIWAHNSSLEQGSPLAFTYANTQANAMGKMLIYLLENKLITL